MKPKRAENDLDAELRAVAVPAGLSARLKRLAEWSDLEIDDALRSLAAPPALSNGIKAVIADEALDEMLLNVPVSRELIARLRITTTIRPDSTLRRFVMAASLLFIMLGSFFGALGGLFTSIRPFPHLVSTLHVIDLGPTRLVASAAEPVTISRDGTTNLFGVPTVPVMWKGGSLDVELVRLDTSQSYGVAGQLINDVEQGLELDRDVVLMRWDAYGSPQHAGIVMPALDQVQTRADSGVDLPLVGGYDRSFLLRTSTHPPTFVAASSQLETIRVPLVTSSRSYQQALLEVANRKVPDARTIFIEEFLAAPDYGFPMPATDDVSITVVAGPSMFSGQDSSLLQVGAQAARQLGNRSTHLSVVVDVSRSMQRERRLGTVRNSLRQLFDHLSPDDAVSLVAVNHQITQQVDFATVNDRDLLGAWLASLQVGGGDDLLLGIRTALSLAPEAQDTKGKVRQLAILTDQAGSEALGNSSASIELLADVENQGLRVAMFPICDAGQATRGIVPDELPWKLVELVTGMSSVVARDAQFEVIFNPKAVLAYRLIGHGPSAMTGVGDPNSGGEMRSGQQATVLFEVWLRDSLEDEVANAQFRWTSPSNASTDQSVHAVLGRYDIATRGKEAAHSLQIAAIAAEVAGRLQGVGDFELRGNQRFREVRKRSEWTQLASEMQKVTLLGGPDAEVSRWLELVQRLDRISRGGTAERSREVER